MPSTLSVKSLFVVGFHTHTDTYMHTICVSKLVTASIIERVCDLNR